MEQPQAQKTSWFVTKNGVKVSGPLDEGTARAEAARLQQLCESTGERASFGTVQSILG